MTALATAARLGRLRGLDTLSDARGIFALAAIDHRDALGVAFANAGFPSRRPSGSPSSRPRSPVRSRRMPPGS